MARPTHPPVVELRGISKLYGRGATLVRALDARRPRRGARRLRRRHGRVGSGQVDADDIIGCRTCPAVAGTSSTAPTSAARRDAARRSSATARSASSSSRSSSSRADRARQRELPLAYAGVRPARAAQAGAGRARRVGLADRWPTTALPAVGRRAAARGDRAGDRHRPGAAAGRRADRARSTAEHRRRAGAVRRPQRRRPAPVVLITHEDRMSQRTPSGTLRMCDGKIVSDERVAAPTDPPPRWSGAARGGSLQARAGDSAFGPRNRFVAEVLQSWAQRIRQPLSARWRPGSGRGAAQPR